MLTNEQKRKINILNQYRHLVQCIDTRAEELAQWEAKLTGATSILRDTPGGNYSHDKIGDGVSVIMDIKRELAVEMLEMMEKRKKVLTAINDVKDPRLRLLLRQRYINGLSFSEIAAKSFYSRRHIYRLHEMALDKVDV